MGEFMTVVIAIVSVTMVILMAIRAYIEINAIQHRQVAETIKQILEMQSELKLLEGLKYFIRESEPKDYPKDDPKLQESYFDGYYELKDRINDEVFRLTLEIKAKKDI